MKTVSMPFMASFAGSSADSSARLNSIFITMQIEACLICDSASDYHGKLCILGAFDSIGAHQAPLVHPHCATVVRLRFERSEEGKHPFRLILIDQDGRPHGPRIDGEVNVVFNPEHETVVTNLILNVNGLQLPRFGVFHFDLIVDGSLKARMPLYVRQVNQMPKAA